MKLAFKKDLFFNSKIKWGNKISKKNLIDLNKITKTYIYDCKFELKKSKGLEKNSNNFKINIRSKKILLKKWRKNMRSIEVLNIIKLMKWLNSKNIPVQKPLKFNNGEYLLNYKKELWSIFNFVEGNHFKGNSLELKNVAKNIGILINTMQHYPTKKFIKAPKYFTKEDESILKEMSKKNFDFRKKFGKYSTEIKKYLPLIVKIFKKFRYLNYKIQNRRINHIDLHPHNIITKKNKIIAFLDFDSCKIINEGYSIGYNLLKLCKQTVLYNKGKINKKTIARKFLTILNKEYKINNIIKKNIYYFAISEVLRRLLFMFRLTIKKNNKNWNRIIPIQLGHIDECEQFFLKKNHKMY